MQPWWAQDTSFKKKLTSPKLLNGYLMVLYCIILPQPYHPAAQDRLPTEAKQGWAWSVPGWETSGENQVLLEEVLVRPAGGAHPVVCVGPNTPV